jgi:hypothetical protein
LPEVVNPAPGFVNNAAVIVVDAGPDLILVTQGDHARLAAEMLSLWRAGGLPDHPRRAELLFAVREHDNGWAEADAAPRLDVASGRPSDFRAFPSRNRLEVWERGVGRWVAERPYAGLLILSHARALHRHLREDAEWGPFLERLDEDRELLLEAAGVEPEDLEADYRWLELVDRLSLMACNRWTKPLERPDLRARFQRGRLELSPFPLAGATTFRLPCRRVPARHYSGDADLGGELASARWTTDEIRLTPWKQRSSGTGQA